MGNSIEAKVADLGERWAIHISHMPDAPPGQMAWLRDDGEIRSAAIALLLTGVDLRGYDLTTSADPATAIPVRLDALHLLVRVLTDTEPRDTMQGHGEVPNWRARSTP